MAMTLVLGAGTGALIDLRTRRIPNVVVLLTLASGLGWAASGATGVTLPSAAAGALLGLVLMLPGHCFGGTGAGDVKLFAAAGAVIGIEQVPQAFLFTLIAGGGVAAGVAAARGRLAATAKRAAKLLASPGETRREIERDLSDHRFPYGPAIAAGTVLAVLV